MLLFWVVVFVVVVFYTSNIFAYIGVLYLLFSTLQSIKSLSATLKN